MLKRLVLPASILLLAACEGPKVVPITQNEQFKLSMLAQNRIAIWPIAFADLDVSTSSTVASEYGTQARFLDALSLKISKRIIDAGKVDSIGSDQVLELLGKDPATRALLDPVQLIGTADLGNRFAAAPVPPGLATLAQLPALRGVRYVLVARSFALGRHVTRNTMAGGGGTWQPNGRGGNIFVGGGMTTTNAAKTNGNLRLAILDLELKAVVWDGNVFADASSNFMKTTALHEVEDEVALNLVHEILGLH